MNKIRVGFGFDVHALAEGRPLKLGGIEVPFKKGCVAHSDGDVAAHALCDALLGAAALGDIGRHFPDSAQEYAGIDSLVLLERVAKLLHEKEFDIGNADITIAMQEPKLAEFIPTMRTRLSDAMGIGFDYVSVKATTTEHMGFEGRGEGVSAYAVVLITER